MNNIFNEFLKLKYLFIIIFLTTLVLYKSNANSINWEGDISPLSDEEWTIDFAFAHLA